MSIFSLQNIAKLGAPALGLGALIAASFWGQDRNANQTSQVTNPVAPLADPGDPPELPAVDDYGGAKDILTSPLAGVSNRDNPRGTVPRIFGAPMKVFPPLSARPHTIRTSTGSILQAVFEFGPGPLQIANYKLGGVPLSKYPTIALEERFGYPSDTNLTSYTQDVEQQQFNELVAYNAPVIKRTKQFANFIHVTLIYPDGIYRTVNGQRLPARGSFQIVITNIDGSGWVSNATPEFIDFSLGPRIYEYAFAVPPGIYDVYVDRTRLYFGDLYDDEHPIYWTALTETNTKYPFSPIRDANGTEIKMARVAMRAIQDQTTPDLSGAIGELSAEVTSLLRPHDGTSWQPRIASANNAWVMLEILTGSANYRPAADDRIDFPAFKAFGDWCDAQGFTYSNIIDSARDMSELLREVAQAGLGYFIPNKNGKYSVGIDKAIEDVAFHFHPRNIIKDSFTARVSYLEPLDYIAAQFINPEADYQLDERKVFDDGKVEGQDFKHETIRLVGVKSKAAAYKIARRLLASHKLRSWIYQFETDVEHFAVSIGDKIRITHDLLGAGLGQGVIKSVQMSGPDCVGITIDAPQELFAGTRYQVRIILSPGDSVVREIVNTDNLTGAFTFLTPISGNLPEVGYPVVFGELNFDSIEAIVINKEPNESMGAVLTCVDYAPDVYKAETETIPEWTSKLTFARRREVEIPAPQVIAVQSNESVLEKAGDGSFRPKILITLGGLPDYVDQVEYQIKTTGQGGWGPANFVSARAGSISIYEVEEKKTYDIQVRSRKGNFISDWTPISAHTVIGKTTPPPDVPNMITKEPDSSVIKWFYDSAHGVDVPRDHAGFVVKIAWNAFANWQSGYVLSPLCLTTRFDIGGLARGLKTIMIKAIDVAGNEQAGPPAILQLDFGEALLDNVIETIAHGPTFSIGQFENCFVEDGKLKNNDNGSLFWGPDDAPFWGPDNDLFWDVQYIPGSYTWKFTPDSTEAKPFKVKVKASVVGPYVLEYRTGGNQLFWGNDNDLFWGPDDDLFWPPAEQFQPVPDDGIEGDWIEYEFRIRLLGGPQQTIVESLETIVDVKDLIEYVDDFEVTSAGGSRPTLTKTFRKIKRIRIDLQSSIDHPDAASARSLDKLETGPLIGVFDPANAGTTGIVDLTIQGY